MRKLSVQVKPVPGARAPEWAEVVQDKSGRRVVRMEFEAATLEGERETAKHAEAIGYVQRAKAEGASCRAVFVLGETGGGLTNRGSALCYCAVDGSELVGWGGRSTCGGVHRMFFPSHCLEVAVSRYRDTRRGTVTELAVGDDLLPVERVLYRFDDERGAGITVVTATSILYPELCVEAARAKAGCYHCRECHYGRNGKRQ